MTLQVSTSERVELVDLTDAVSDAIPEASKSGVCTVFVPHTTAGVVVNENEPRLRSDIEQLLEQLAPQGAEYDHDQIDANAAAHLRSIVLGESVSVPVVDGELGLGTWQSIMFVECDGPRTRQVEVASVAD